MTQYHFVLVHPPTRLAYPLFGIVPIPLTIATQILITVGIILIASIAVAGYNDMLRPGLQAAASLHPSSSKRPPTEGGSQALRRAQQSSGALLSSSSGASVLLASQQQSSSSSSSRQHSVDAARKIPNHKYKGLRNTGNTCFFNSTLQSLSALPTFRQYLYTLVDEAERWDTPTPVIDAVIELLDDLASPSERTITINPSQLVRALQNLPSSSIRSLVGAHQQQDAHELFALLNEAVDAEAKMIRFDRQEALESEHAGLKTLMAPSLPWGGKAVHADPSQTKLSLPSIATSTLVQDLAADARGGAGTGAIATNGNAAHLDATALISPFDALLAQRTICLDCGYCEAIRHFSTSEISLSVPAMNIRTPTSQATGTSACSLQECLAMWSDLEQVDWICWNCSLRSTLASIRADLASKSAGQNGSALANGHANRDGKDSKASAMTAAKKKRLAALRSRENKVAKILASGLSEEEIKQESDDPSSPFYNILNNVQLIKTMSGLSTKQIMISRPPRILALHLNRSSYSASAWAPSKNNRHVLFPEYLDLAEVTLQGTISTDGRIAMNHATLNDSMQIGEAPMYRLSAIVVHYGSHSFGHYVAFKRVPSTYHRNGDGLSLDDGNGEDDEWLRISDESVSRSTIRDVKSENPFMLFYELIPGKSISAKSHLPKIQLSNGASYAELQNAISGAMNGQPAPEDAQGEDEGANRLDLYSDVPLGSKSLHITPRTVHRWSTPPIH